MHDESGIAWDVETHNDGTRSLRVAARPGRRYTIEQSADLVEWSPVRSWLGLASGQMVSTDIFVGPPPPGAPVGQTPPPTNTGETPRTASLIIQPVEDGGAVLLWWRGGASTPVRIHEPASGGNWGPPTLTTLHTMEMTGWTVMLQSRDLVWSASSPSLPPADPLLSQDDSDFHALLLANRAAIAAAVQSIHDNQQAALQEARLHGLPAGASAQGRYFRVREDSGIDTDGDGLTDEQELALGLNIFCGDTDGDGMDDRYEVANGLNGRNCGDAALDFDFDGRTNLQECLVNSDPCNDDTDGDGIKDGEDAVPDCEAIDWHRTPEGLYAWIPIPDAPLQRNAVTGAELTNDPVILFGPSPVDGASQAVKRFWDGSTVRVLSGGLPGEVGDGGWVFGTQEVVVSETPTLVTHTRVVCWTPGCAEPVPVETWSTEAAHTSHIAMRTIGAWGGGTSPRLAGADGRFLLGQWTKEVPPEFGGLGIWSPAEGSGWNFDWIPGVSTAWDMELLPGPVAVLHSVEGALVVLPDGTPLNGPFTDGTYWITPAGHPCAVNSTGVWKFHREGNLWNDSTRRDQTKFALAGRGKMNARGEVLDTFETLDPVGGRLWRNGAWVALDDLLPPSLRSAGWLATAADINDGGLMLVGLRGTGTGAASDFSQVGFLAPVELDVNNNGQTGDRVDGPIGYLPGYEGTTAKLHSGADFEHTTYSGPQAMRLVMRGFGTGTVDAAEFKIVGVTNHKGFCGNGDDDTHFGEGKDDDFSFEAETNQREVAGQVADGQVWAPLFCKDYGGWCEIEIVLKKGGQPVTPQPIRLTVPLDDNHDKIADAWQDAQIEAWNIQFKPQPARQKNASVRTSMTLIAEGAYIDAEEADSDGPGPSPAMADVGDGLTVLDEYRGYILDGGPELVAPNHRRLSAARKELLVECSVEDGLTSVAKNGQGTNQEVLAGFTVAAALKDVSDFYRNAKKGGGIDLYWAEDKIVQPGAVIDYGPPFPAPFPSHGAREWGGTIYYSRPEFGNSVCVTGNAIPMFDDALRVIDRTKHDNIYRGSMLKLHGENRNPKLEGFVKLLLPTRRGELLGGVKVNDGPPLLLTVDPSEARYLLCPLGSEGDTCGATINIAALADEGRSHYSSLLNGHDFTAIEFASIARLTIGHEVGHLVVGRWHPVNPSKITIMENDHAYVLDGGRVLGLSDATWDNEEIGRINLRERLSAHLQP